MACLAAILAFKGLGKLGKKKKRITRLCVLCGVETSRMSQHFNRQHPGIGDAEKKEARIKMIQSKPISHKDHPVLKICPFCDVPVQRLDNHLAGSHAIQRKSAQMRLILNRPHKSETKETEDVILHEFRVHLAAKNGGDNNAEETARGHMANVHKFADMVGGLRNLVNTTDSLTTINEYLQQQGYAPKTKHKYLDSVAKFARFILSRVGKVYFPEVARDDVHMISELVGEYKSGLTKHILKREAENRSKIADKILDPEAVRELKERLKEKAEAAIDEIRAGSTSWDNQRTVRDYLLVDLFTGNAQRSCVGETATLSEYEERKEVDGKIMLKVKEHKTAYRWGPADVFFSRAGSVILKEFVEEVRPLTSSYFPTKNGEEFLFVHSNGRGIRDIGPVLDTLWRSQGNKGQFFPRTLRATVSTKTREFLAPTEAAKVATFMKHSYDTQGKFYVAAQSELESYRCSEFIQGLWCKKDKEEDDERPQAKKVKRQLVSQFSSSSQIGDANIVPPTPVKVISFLSKKTRKRGVKETQDPEWIPPSNPTPGPRKLMTEEEEMTVESRVRNVISHNKGRPEPQSYQQLMKLVYESMGTEFTNKTSRKQFMDRCRHQHYREKYYLA